MGAAAGRGLRWSGGWTGRLEPGPGRRLDAEAGHCSTVAGVMEAADHCYTHPGEYQQQ